ncbi:protein tyrosine/serine phosphatase [Thermobaculum terrenum ATCC BAA-798]|uniref:Protein tyrosine/serine phosphatase n=1 Tax=Thermobaculum terrenum (strain ATCC BAA-798 / CCMEE 7001 / YNP1) TaxID=525904 RepID=D1CIH8_THET1|nr:tyrosine-protein phosphatase [Thermobaculum terrenum]ACZ43549.1 protein tyrosine/serine phosphatase [Thermobaculum terrenum ATCC BAA-798]
MAIGEERVRVLGWEGCLNVRDLGGYASRYGGETRWGAVIRADNLARLTEAGRRDLLAHGVRTVIDLRMPEEVRLHPNPFAKEGEHGVRYHNISFLDPAVPKEDFTTLANDYKWMLDTFSASVAEVMRVIASAPEGAVLFHCMGGKDRTGLISALLLEVAGVDRETIAADYALTQECLRPEWEAWLESEPDKREERERELAKYMPTKEVMLEVLEYLDERYGGPIEYLRRAGVSEEELERIRARLVPIED